MADTFTGWVILEEWRPVTGFEDLYEVSDFGRIRRVGPSARQGKGRGGGARLGRVLRDQDVPGGYRKVQLWKSGRPYNRLVHLLVANAFLGSSPDGTEVNHEDGDKTNNAVTNLEYLTHGDNNRHAYRTGLRAVAISQMIRVRRKPRTLISCACGCGTRLETPDGKGRDRRYISGHNMRRAS